MQIFICIIFILILSVLPAVAQTQQGYSNERPQIVIDNSVLEDLKGYQPPPMFDDNTTSQPIEPPISPVLTAPKAEILLNHPVQNFRVLTERNSQVQKLVPVPTPRIPQKIENKESVIPIKKDAPKEPKKKEVIQQALKNPIKTSQSQKEAYKPKASPTMPAVPPIHVEKDILPALPLPTPDAKNISTPSIGERMIDAALESKIEKDDVKIKEKLAEEKNNLVKKPKQEKTAPEKKSIVKIQNNSLEFQMGQMDLTDKIETQIRKSILPEITNDLNSRIQILSFATSPDKSESTAKRISLTRALSVRDYLKKMNIDMSRIDVRALASDNSIPPDRVDIILLK